MQHNNNPAPIEVNISNVNYREVIDTLTQFRDILYQCLQILVNQIYEELIDIHEISFILSEIEKAWDKLKKNKIAFRAIRNKTSLFTSLKMLFAAVAMCKRIPTEITPQSSQSGRELNLILWLGSSLSEFVQAIYDVESAITRIKKEGESNVSSSV